MERPGFFHIYCQMPKVEVVRKNWLPRCKLAILLQSVQCSARCSSEDTLVSISGISRGEISIQGS